MKTKSSPLPLLCLILLLLSAPLVLAQTRIIKGTVLDSATHAPLGFASVAISNGKQETTFAGASTDQQGRFMLRYTAGDSVARVSFSFVGYKKVDILIKGKTLETDLGNILLAPASGGLALVEVTARRPLVEFEGSGMRLNVQDVPHINHMSTDEVLDYLPFIQADGEAVKMMGQPLAILINNKPHPLYSEAKNLKLLPSHSIERVDITLVPTARQGSGQKVMNITLKKDYFLGWNGRASLSVSRLGIAPTGQISYWRKKLGFDLSLSLGSSRNDVDESSKLENLRAGTLITRASDVSQFRDNLNLHSSFYYNLDSANTVDFQVGIGSNSDRLNNSTLLGYSGSNGSNRFDTSIYVNRTRGVGGNASLNFTHKFKRQGNEFYFLSRFNDNSSDEDYRLTYGTEHGPTAEIYSGDSGNKELSAELVFQNHSKDKVKYVYGSKLIKRWYASTNRIVNSSTRDIPADSIRFSTQQLISSSYADVEVQSGAYTAHGGLRVEYATFGYRYPDLRSQSFLDFLPTVSFSRNLSEKHQVSLNYYRQLARPGLSYLLPFETSQNAYERRTGTVGLKPEYTNYFTLQGYGNYKFGSLGVELSYSRIRDLLNEVASANDDGGILRSEMNIDHNDSWTVGFNAEIPLLKRIRISHLSNLSYVRQTSGAYANSMWSGYLSEKIMVELGKSQRLAVSILAFSPNVLLQGRSQSMAYLNTNFNYSRFFKFFRKLPSSISLGVHNPWLWKGLPSFTEQRTPDLITYSESYKSNPYVSISLQVTFLGKQYSDRTFSKSKSIHNNDVKAED